VSENRPFVDLARQAWPKLSNAHYNSAVFCAAATKLAECEEKPHETRKINVNAIVSLSKILSKKGAHLLLLSTNQVFDGSRPNRTISESVCPINEYGRQKAEVEKHLLRMPGSAVLRMTKVIYPDLPLLIGWREKLKAGIPIEAFTDMSLAPVMLCDVVQRIDELMNKQATGLHHFSSMKDISYYLFAQQFALEHNCNTDLVTTQQCYLKHVPKYTSLI
jgi:dTDP-4-dehydrorhamnose reductase